jgi:hypothetical protein
MAISRLVAGGAGGVRPPIGAFFGKSTAANDNAQKVSSDFIITDMIGSFLGNISGITAELKKIQQFSKDAIKSFERLVVDMRKLNNDTTLKFKTVNALIKKDNMEFLRSITMTYQNISGTAGVAAAGIAGAVNVPETKDESRPAGSGSSITSILGGLAGAALTGAALVKGAKSAIAPVAAGAKVAAVAEGAAKPALSAVVKKKVAGSISKTVLKAIPGVAALAGVFFAASRALDGDLTGAGLEIASGAAASIPGVGTAASLTTQVGLLARDIYKEHYGIQFEDDPLKQERMAEIIEMVKKELTPDIGEVIAAPTEKPIAQTGRNMTSRNLAASIGGPEATREKAAANPDAGTPAKSDERFKGKSVEEITDILWDEHGDHMIAQKEAELIFKKLNGKYDADIESFKPLWEQKNPDGTWKNKFTGRDGKEITDPEERKKFQSSTGKNLADKIESSNSDNPSRLPKTTRTWASMAENEISIPKNWGSFPYTADNLRSAARSLYSEGVNVSSQESVDLSRLKDRAASIAKMKSDPKAAVTPTTPTAPADKTSGAVPGADRFQMNSAVKAEYEKLIKEQPLSWQNDASVQRDAYDEAMLIVRSKGGSVFSGSPTKVSDASSSPSAPADGTSGAAATGSSGSASGAAETGSSGTTSAANGTPSAATASVAPAPAQPERTTRSLSQSESTLKIGGMPAVEGQPLAPIQISAIDLALGMNPANAKNYPAWVLDQYAKQKRKEGTPDKGMGDQTKPDLGTGGEDASGGGGGGGGGGDPTGKSETEAGAPGGTPEPIQSAPPNVPADLVPPSQQNQDNTPIVMNNNSSSSSGSISGGAADKVSGQNLPMNAQNASLTEYFAKQNISYQ